MASKPKGTAKTSSNDDDPVIEADIESFPASDPPGWIPAHVGPAVPIRPEPTSRRPDKPTKKRP